MAQKRVFYAQNTSSEIFARVRGRYVSTARRRDGATTPVVVVVVVVVVRTVARVESTVGFRGRTRACVYIYIRRRRRRRRRCFSGPRARACGGDRTTAHRRPREVFRRPRTMRRARRATRR